MCMCAHIYVYIYIYVLSKLKAFQFGLANEKTFKDS